MYDLRGITEGLESDDPHLGLIQFKVGTGGEAVEYVGEWDLPLNPLLYAAFDLYMKRRRRVSGDLLRVDVDRWRDHLRRGRGRDPRARAGEQGERVRLRAGPAGRGGGPAGVRLDGGRPGRRGRPGPRSLRRRISWC